MSIWVIDIKTELPGKRGAEEEGQRVIKEEKYIKTEGLSRGNHSKAGEKKCSV